MRICFVADARSPIARGWISYFAAHGHEVHIISSYPCPPNSFPADSLHVVPVAFSGLAKAQRAAGFSNTQKLSTTASMLARLRWGPAGELASDARYWVASLEIYRHIGRIRDLIRATRPDLVHAMRIPFEGISAALGAGKVPLLISVWGNDFTLFANRYPLIGSQTRRAMRRTNALHSDCLRDIRLAHSWGFDGSKPSVVLPGAGGVQSELFHPGSATPPVGAVDVRQGVPVVMNPRGFRTYVRNDTFFQAMPLVLHQHPDAVFLCCGMQGSPIAENWITRLGIRGSVHLLPPVPHESMGDLFRLAQVTVSPSTHDGTPNTLLEGMACGCFPVAGNIESVREWITDGVNGLLCDPASPKSLADAIVHALGDGELRHRAAQHNVRLIAERAQYGKVMASAEDFYRRVIEYATTRQEI